jgi:hypothetical protein
MVMALAPRLPCPGARIVTFMLGGIQEIGSAVAAASAHGGAEGAVAALAVLERMSYVRGRRGHAERRRRRRQLRGESMGEKRGWAA